MDEFLVLDNPCTYNAILRRGALNEIKFVMSTYILQLKFSTPHSVEEVNGNQGEARSCVCGIVRRLKPTNLMMAENTFQPEKEVLEIDTLDPSDEEKELRGELLEELEDLVLDSNKPDQVLCISN